MAEQTFERKVIKGFTDKHTKKPYPKGSVYTSTDRERINELVKKGNISGDELKTLKEVQEEADEKSKEKYEGIKDEIKAEDMTMDELRQVVESEGLEVEGTGKNGAIKKEDYVKALKV